MVDTLYALAALASALAAVLAWVAKLRWSKEYGAAKDEIIRAKDAHIAVLTEEVRGLRELTPMKVREYFVSVKEQLEEYNDSLKQGLEAAKSEIQEKDRAIGELRLAGSQRSVEVQALEKERDDLRNAAQTLEKQLATTRELAGQQIAAFAKGALVDQKSWKALEFSLKEFRDALAHQQNPAKLAELLLLYDRQDLARYNLNMLFNSFTHYLEYKREPAEKPPEEGVDGDSGSPPDES